MARAEVLIDYGRGLVIGAQMAGASVTKSAQLAYRNSDICISIQGEDISK